MENRIQFETPENVQVNYKIAGVGARFVAWVIDNIIITFCMILIFFAVAVIFPVILDTFSLLDFIDPENMQSFPLYLFSIIILLFGFGNFMYYGIMEFFMQGQTLGKRSAKIRVTKANGFSLDSLSIFIRNVFRILDTTPLFWIIPLLSKKTQRLGDMAAGTLVIYDNNMQLNPLHEKLLQRQLNELTFRFDARALQKTREKDVTAVDELMLRWNDLDRKVRKQLCNSICPALAERIGVDLPSPDEYPEFLRDFLTAEVHRQYRHLS